MQRSYVQSTASEKLVRLAELVEQWTGNSEAVVTSPQSSINFRMLTSSY